MAQPDYVLVTPADRVREGDRMPVARSWEPVRPGEITGLRPPEGPAFGTTGPDQGYGLKLANRFRDRLQLQPGEHAEDAVAGCLGVGLRRAARMGRAPVIYDFELAFTLFGFLGGAPEDLIDFRRSLFADVAHDYWRQRAVVDAVADDSLLLLPSQVRERLSDWRSLMVVGAGAPS